MISHHTSEINLKKYSKCWQEKINLILSPKSDDENLFIETAAAAIKGRTKKKSSIFHLHL